MSYNTNVAKNYERRDDRVRQIAQAALELISEEGLRRFTTKAIAEKVGITDGAIFKHFKNKDEIVVAAMDLLEESLFADGFSDQADGLKRLETLFRARAKMLGSQAALGRLMFSEQLAHAVGETGRLRLQSWRERNMKFVHGCLNQLKREGRLPKGLEPRDLSVIVQGTLLTFAFERTLKGPTADELSRRINAAWRTICRLVDPGACA